MNIPPDIVIGSPAVPESAQPAAPMESCMRRHPGGALLFAAGLGIGVVLVVRALTPTPPRNRALVLLEDIQQQLATLAENGAHAAGNGMDSLGALHLERSFAKLGRRFKKLFH